MSTLSTENWDTAYAIRFGDVNAAIAASRASPPGFSGTHSAFDTTYRVSADFGPWRATGGSGSLLIMTLPLTRGRLSGGGQPDTPFEGEARIEVSLRFVPRTGDAATEDLRLDGGRAAVLGVELSSGPSSALDTIGGALGDWLAAGHGVFDHAFAAVTMTRQTDGAFAWVKPTSLGYAVYAGPAATAEGGVLGVLAMTEDRPGVNLSSTMDPGIIPDGADAGFLVAASRVIDELFAPGIDTLFAGARPGDFGRQDDGMTIVNVNPVSLATLTLADGSTIDDARVLPAGFTLSISSGFVDIAFTGLKFTWRGQYDVSVDYRSRNHLSTDAGGRLQLQPASPPTVSVSIAETSSQKQKDLWASVGFSVCMAVIGAALGGVMDAGIATAAADAAVTAGAEAGVADIGTDAIVDGMSTEDESAGALAAFRAAARSLAEPGAPQTFMGLFRMLCFKLLGVAVGSLLGTGKAGAGEILRQYGGDGQSKPPTLDAFAGQATGTVRWAGGADYELTSARLRGALQIGLRKAS